MKTLFGALLVVFSSMAIAETCAPNTEKSVYWGDLHIHTSFSMDAYVWDNQVQPEDAYRFAKGHPQQLLDGSEIKLDRPLDFAAVTDHAEYFGVTYACLIENPKTPYCRDLLDVSKEESPRGFYEFFLPALLRGDRLCQNGEATCPQAERSLWERIQDAANQANDPCQFTAFIANEWTPSPGNLHWHRNIIYANEHVPQHPINSFDQPDQKDLWRVLDASCVGECDVLAIPHNSNLGMGGTFDLSGHDVNDLSDRARFERLVEIHQHKGSSECIAGIASAANFADEDCDFEIMLPVPLLRKQAAGDALTGEEHAKIAQGYVRNTLLRGLETKAQEGVNPFVYGFIGSTDTHSARPGSVEEQGWRGSIGTYDQDPERLATYTHYNPGGLAAVWAKENTREAIFAALKNRETYATSGPRIELRVDMFPHDVKCAEPDSNTASLEGVVMGGVYTAKAEPTVRVRVAPDRNPLERVDVIKLTYAEGEMRQQVKRIDLSDADRLAGGYCATWSDVTYEPNVPTAYYVRVLEVPSPRWDGKSQVQERAWSSPIWNSAGYN